MTSSLIRCALSWTLALGLACTLAVAARAQEQVVTLRAARVIDGRGNVISNGTVEVVGGKITKVDQRKGPVTFDLGNATLLPGLIDVHVHIGYHFGKDGRAQNDGETESERTL